MLISDLLHSCAHESVAEAAVASIGGGLAAGLRSEAENRGVSLGFLAASLVRGFARDASEKDWRDLVDATRGQDFPVLSGLQVILSKPRNLPALQPNESTLGARVFAADAAESGWTARLVAS